MNYKDYIDGQKKRNKQMAALRFKNPIKWTFKALGDKFDVTPQRAEQICKKEQS